jgi:hypothetical protein
MKKHEGMEVKHSKLLQKILVFFKECCSMSEENVIEKL